MENGFSFPFPAGGPLIISNCIQHASLTVNIAISTKTKTPSSPNQNWAADAQIKCIHCENEFNRYLRLLSMSNLAAKTNKPNKRGADSNLTPRKKHTAPSHEDFPIVCLRRCYRRKKKMCKIFNAACAHIIFSMINGVMTTGVKYTHWKSIQSKRKKIQNWICKLVNIMLFKRFCTVVERKKEKHVRAQLFNRFFKVNFNSIKIKRNDVWLESELKNHAKTNGPNGLNKYYHFANGRECDNFIVRRAKIYGHLRRMKSHIFAALFNWNWLLINIQTTWWANDVTFNDHWQM